MPNVKRLERWSKRLNQIAEWAGQVAMWANAMLMIAIVTQVGLRYLLRWNFTTLDELQWHLFAVAAMFGLSSAMTRDCHIRVDVLHSQFSVRMKATIELIGLLGLVCPFLFLMIDQGWDYAYESWRVNERSETAMGLPFRWILKGSIPVAFVMLAVATAARILETVARLAETRQAVTRTGARPLLVLWLALTLVAILVSGFVEPGPERLVVALFATFLALLFSGFPVAWVLAGTGVLYCGLAWIGDHTFRSSGVPFNGTLVGLDYRSLGIVVNRVWSIMTNTVLVALPMFIGMGLMLDESGVAQRLMQALHSLFYRVRGGLLITTTLIGIILAAATGIIGASVVLLGVLALPTLVQQNYAKPLATGTIAAAGTLGILIPPSIMLVIMADQMTLSVGDLFLAALLPGLLIGGLYLGYLVVLGRLRPNQMPLPPAEPSVGESPRPWVRIAGIVWAILPPLGLIFAVLGSIFAGLATPTEASGVGAAGATVLAWAAGRLQISTIVRVVRRTFHTTAYIFAIFVGATCFSFVLRELGGDELIANGVQGVGMNDHATLGAILLFVFLLGFVLDWIEISLIILPLMRPIVGELQLNIPDYGKLGDAELIWFVILVAVALQTSFLTPPVGFALFYLKGVAPREVRLHDIYQGVIPFVILQLVGLLCVLVFPWLATWLPAHAY